MAAAVAPPPSVIGLSEVGAPKSSGSATWIFAVARPNPHLTGPASPLTRSPLSLTPEPSANPRSSPLTSFHSNLPANSSTGAPEAAIETAALREATRGEGPPTSTAIACPPRGAIAMPPMLTGASDT